MNNDHVTSLALELRVDEDLAKLALDEAGGELVRAREILKGLLPKYLVIKARFWSSVTREGSGVIFIVLEKNRKNFHVFRTLLDKDRNWADGVSVRVAPGVFLSMINGYLSEGAIGVRLFDSQRLKDALKPLEYSSSLHYVFDLWDKPKRELIDSSQLSNFNNDPGSILNTVLAGVLHEAMGCAAEVEIDYDFLTSAQFNAIAADLGIILDGESSAKGVITIENQSDQDTDSGLRVTLKGQFVIDPASGIAIGDLHVGDYAYVEVRDWSEIAMAVSRIIGAYKRGLWVPVKGRIVEKQDMIGDRIKVKLVLAKGVYLDAMSMPDIMVRCKSLSTMEAVSRASDASPVTSLVPVLIAAAFLAVFILLLMMVR